MFGRFDKGTLMKRLILIMALALWGCKSTQMLDTTSAIMSHPVADADIENAMRVGLEMAGWQVTDTKPGRIVGHRAGGGDDWWVDVAVTYDDQTYAIEYLGSRGLDYDPATRSIHKNYNTWVSWTNREINKYLADPEAARDYLAAQSTMLQNKDGLWAGMSLSSYAETCPEELLEINSGEAFSVGECASRPSEYVILQGGEVAIVLDSDGITLALSAGACPADAEPYCIESIRQKVAERELKKSSVFKKFKQNQQRAREEKKQRVIDSIFLGLAAGLSQTPQTKPMQPYLAPTAPVAPAYVSPAPTGVLAVWTGRTERVQTVSFKWVWKCEYRLTSGQHVTLLFEQTCPATARVE